ncbi:MAG: hypothetical protein QN152_07740 [Armatimonadota bacterium]|nr:hypothetical protein [Armatimonadota bacterium]MDR7426885.1 hypothetical protein [Armatimonadota bacterium]MDR7464081.1 hypothetical protein [Armatimonadota bacterium]MDR7470903.1 hypothetical protein [Armatimonadota bacterium]MDR7473647.1 hypothetical protein [Armatimonadota bacterium]
MGRTVATMTQVVDQEAASFSRFRRALRREDQEVFDLLFAAARHHAAPAAYQSHASPFEVILLAMLLELGKAVVGLQRRLAELEQVPILPAPYASGAVPAPHPPRARGP